MFTSSKTKPVVGPEPELVSWAAIKASVSEAESRRQDGQKAEGGKLGAGRAGIRRGHFGTQSGPILANVCQLLVQIPHTDMRGIACLGTNDNIDILI